MKCIDIEQLSLYLENEVNEIEYLLINSHLEECRNCRRALNQLKIIDWELEHDKVVIPAQELDNIRINSINLVLSQPDDNDFTLSNLYDLQVNTFKNSVSFIKYLPGVSRIDTQVNTQVNLKKSLGSSVNKLINKMLENVGTII